MGYISRVFRSVVGGPTNIASRHLPMINTVVASYSSYLSEYGQIRKKKALMVWFRGIPELTALASKVARDIVYKWHFEPVNPRETGRNKIFRANKFAQQVQFRKVMLAQAIDMLITGEGFGWLGKISDDQLKKEIANKIRTEIFLESKEKELLSDRVFREIKDIEGFADLEGIDEDMLRPRKYRYIPSSTMETVYDQYDILYYNQVVGVNKERFSLKEIVRYSFMEIDGKPNGFTPVESIIVQLELLRQMWQNMLSIHKNGGRPDSIFALEGINPNSPAYRRIQQQLEKYKVVENKHGNMLWTGKLTVHELQALDKMQFMDSGLYITGLIAMQWQIPRSSIPFILKETNTKEDTGGGSAKSYWRNIEFAQQVYAETMNTQLWMPYFGVKIVFDNTYIQQDVQLQTAKNWEYNNIKLMDEILSNKGKELKEEWVYRKLGISKEDVKELKIIPDNTQVGKDRQLSDSEVQDTEDQRILKKRKKTEQENVISSVGMKPTGVGKEKKTGKFEEYPYIY